MHQKSKYWQAIRGIAIICVILIHCHNGSGYSNGWRNIWFAERAIINFPVGMFLFLSGFFVSESDVDLINRGELKNYYKKRFIRLALPYAFWSICYIILDFVASTVSQSSCPSFLELAMQLVTGGGAPQLYYIIVLLQLTFLTPLLIKTIEKNYGLLLLSLVSVAYTVLIAVYTIYSGSTPRFYDVIFLPWMVFYCVGLFVKKMIALQKIGHKNHTYIKSIAVCSIAVLFIIIQYISSVALLNNGIELGYTVSQNRFTSTIYALYLILVIYYIFQRNQKLFYKIENSKLLTAIGDYSYGIFYTHYFVIYGIKVAKNILDGTPIITILYTQMLIGQLFEFAVTITITFIAIKIIKALTNRSKLLKMLTGI